MDTRSYTRFDAWIAGLEARHFAELTFPEVSRSLRALSSTYVERRKKIREGAALSGAGKRAAFALFYAPLHFLVVDHIVRALSACDDVATLVDLGCGTGAAGAAWASACTSVGAVVGIDQHPWALAEAARTYREFGLTHRTKQSDVAHAPLPKGPAAFVAAFTINELDEPSRERLMAALLERGKNGDRVLVVEPLAGFVARWWNTWASEFKRAGGRADEWRVAADLPPIVAKLDRAAGLNHRELTARSLWMGLATVARSSEAV
jgi:hypothetical protein